MKAADAPKRRFIDAAPVLCYPSPMRFFGILMTGCCAMQPALALAQDQTRREWPSQSQRWTPVIPECTCRAMGRDFRMGEIVCLRTAQGERLAICGMVLNNSSWHMSETPCALSERPVERTLAAK